MAPDDENARPDLGEPSRKTSQKSQRRRIEAERKKERETKKKQERKGEAQDKGEGKEELEEEEDKEEGNEEEKKGERKEKDQDRRKRPLMKGRWRKQSDCSKGTNAVGLTGHAKRWFVSCCSSKQSGQRSDVAWPMRWW